MNEKTIQNALHRHCTDKQHLFIAPNIHTPWGEVDLLSITRSSYIIEHEIKISRSDFRADFRNKAWKHDVIFQDPKANCRKCPNYFVYVVPEDLIKVNEIPSYAGLFYWRPDKWYRFGTITEIIKPPVLHRQKPSVELMHRFARSMMYRYWDYRLKAESTAAIVTAGGKITE